MSKRYQAMDNYNPVMDDYYNIPNKYWKLGNLYEPKNKIAGFEFNPSKYMSVRELYKINGTIPVELVMNPAEDFDAHIIYLAIDRDYKNVTFIAKSRRTFKIDVYNYPDLFYIIISERNELGDWNVIQQVFVSKVSYTVTYLLPFNLNS